MARKQVQQTGGNLPDGTRIGENRVGRDLTFAFPIDGVLPGWVALLRFIARESVDLVGFEVTHFTAPEFPKPGPGLLDRLVGEVTQERLDMDADQAFREWVQAHAERPAPTGVPDGGLTMRRLRGIRVSDFQTTARKFLGAEAIDRGWLGPEWATEAVRRPGGGGRESLHYAELAAAYVRHLAEGSAPIEALALELHLSKSTVRNQVSEARRRGLLTPTQRGRAGGKLTKLATDLLNEGE